MSVSILGPASYSEWPALRLEYIDTDVEPGTGGLRQRVDIIHCHVGRVT